MLTGLRAAKENPKSVRKHVNDGKRSRWSLVRLPTRRQIYRYQCRERRKEALAEV